jgi:hypothetical protein
VSEKRPVKSGPPAESHSAIIAFSADVSSPSASASNASRSAYSASGQTRGGIRPIDIAELMGHRDVKTTLTVYAHLINTDDYTGNMAALGALAVSAQNPSYGNVIPLHG